MTAAATAREGIDYETVADFEVIIPAGATNATRGLHGDADRRTASSRATRPSAWTGTLPGYEVAPSTLTILDDDAPDFSLSVAPARGARKRRPDAGDGHDRDRRRHLLGRRQRCGRGQRRHRHCRRGLRPGSGLRLNTSDYVRKSSARPERPWEAWDKKAVPRTTFNLRLNDYELALLRWLAKRRDESMPAGRQAPVDPGPGTVGRGRSRHHETSLSGKTFIQS